MRCIRHFVILAAVCCLLAVAGCTEEQIRDIDAAAQDADAVIAAGKVILDSPAGALIPSQIRLIMELLGVGIITAIALWKWLVARGLVKANQSLTETARAVVQAIESLDAKPQADVKAAVGDKMTEMASEQKTLTYSEMRAVVDRLKAS